MAQLEVLFKVEGLYLFEVVHFERQLLQREQDELQQRRVVGGFGVGEPRVEQPVATDSDEPEENVTKTRFFLCLYKSKCNWNLSVRVREVRETFTLKSMVCFQPV